MSISAAQMDHNIATIRRMLADPPHYIRATRFGGHDPIVPIIARSVEDDAVVFDARPVPFDADELMYMELLTRNFEVLYRVDMATTHCSKGDTLSLRMSLTRETVSL